MRRASWIVLAPVAALATAAALGGKPAQAGGEDPVEKAERCATRLSIAFLGESATATALSSADPQTGVDAMLATPKFIERFARFVNASFNDEPGTSVEDAPYHLAKYILTNGKPYKDLFVGAYDVTQDAQGAVVVRDDANGLGYFRTDAWMKRYAGNEPAGIRIVTAYRMMNNTLGLELIASTNAPGADISATGRQAPECAGCHYQPWFALDHVASILKRRVGTGANITFADPPSGPRAILGGITVGSDKELVNALVSNDAFKHRACRMAFKFLYGRYENKCEGDVFDKCVDAFTAQGTIQSALAAVAKDPSFCQ